jgi:two-component system KDP operon response regulator KdpE
MKQYKPKILVIDDEPRMVEILTLTLEEAGFQVLTALNGKAGLQIAYAEHPNLVLLDIMIPGMDGFQVLDHLRAMTDVPIIMLTAAAYDTNHIRGMNKGATDFLAKGIRTEVLLSHIHKRLREHAQQSKPQAPRWSDEKLQVDVKRRILRVESQEVRLTPIQWKILECLLEHEGEVTSYQVLLAAGWEDPDLHDVTSVKVQISLLRHKLNDRAGRSRYIHTIREEGYLFEVR